MIKIGYYVKDKELEKKIIQLSSFDHEFLVYELYSNHIDEIKRLKIDIMIFDFYPNEMELIIQFEKIKEILKIKGICVLSEYSDDLVSLILSHHIRHICDLSVSEKALYVMILRIMNEYEKMKVSIYDRIDQVCSSKGISMHLKGYEFIKCGVLYLFENNQHECLMKDIYDTIAKKYHTTSSRVEKNMRLAIHTSGSDLSNSKFIHMCYRECLNE